MSLTFSSYFEKPFANRLWSTRANPLTRDMSVSNGRTSSRKKRFCASMPVCESTHRLSVFKRKSSLLMGIKGNAAPAFLPFPSTQARPMADTTESRSAASLPKTSMSISWVWALDRASDKKRLTGSFDLFLFHVKENERDQKKRECSVLMGENHERSCYR